MKKIYVVSKTHLDLGYTDYASTVEKKYAEDFFPAAIQLGKKLNTDKKRFVWTTGSWIIENTLKKTTGEQKKNLEEALEQGLIAPHALSFTTHCELLDEDTFRYSLEIAKKLEEKYHLNIIAAKLTDVPGHTKSIVPLLAEFGIKLLHIGVNDSSAMPKVPQAFVWKNGDAEVIVVYEGSYGRLYKNEHIDEILCFAHSSDNQGPNNEENLLDIYKKLETNFPDYEVCAATLDEYAERLCEVKDKLPIVTSEIGDSWIHGTATDPYKTAAIKELIALKNKWLNDKSLIRGSTEYNEIANAILCLCEHTWGMDVKRHLSDIGVFLKKDFIKARSQDKVKISLFPLKGLKWKLRTIRAIRKGFYKEGSYSKIEKSWQEQRDYIDMAMFAMTPAHQKETVECLKVLRPTKPFDKKGYTKMTKEETFSCSENILSLNNFGGIKYLSLQGNIIIHNNNEGAVSYVSYGAKDYDFWLHNYTRDLPLTEKWVIGDFARPALQCYDKQFSQGRFYYNLDEVYFDERNCSVISTLKISSALSEELGAPRKVEIKYTFEGGKLVQEVILLDKDASRLTEALFLHFNFDFEEGKILYKKLGRNIDPYDIVPNGNRNLSAVEQAEFGIKGKGFVIKNYHSPLISLGKGKILRFDNKFGNILVDGIAYNLYNNVWGTNFPLWYSENIYSKFELSLKD